MPGVEGKPPTRDEMLELRQRALNKIEEEGMSSFNPADVERLRNNDGYVERFWMHVYDQPGSQLDEAVKTVVKAFKWRKSYGVENLDDSALNRDLLDKGAFFSHGTDKQGAKLIVFHMKNYVRGNDFEAWKKILVYWLERNEREREGGMISWVFDCKGAGLKNMDIEIINWNTECMEHYYPYILNLIYIFEMPWLMNAGFKIVKNALPAAGVARLRDVTKKDFGKFVDDDNRLEAWGGNDDWDFEFEPEILKQQPVKEEVISHSENHYEDMSELRLRNQSSQSFASSTPSRASTTSFDTGVERGFNNTGGLLRVFPSPDISFSSVGRDLQATLTMTSLSKKTVAFKLKTTSPDIFRVRPSTGCLSPGKSVKVDILVTQSDSLPREKFLISAVSVDKVLTSHQEVKAALKRGRPESEYRLRCVVGGASSAVGSGGQPTMANGGAPGKASSGGGDDMKKEAAKMMKKVNEVAERSENLESQVMNCMYGLGALLGLNLIMLILLLFFNSCPEPVIAKTEL